MVRVGDLGQSMNFRNWYNGQSTILRNHSSCNEYGICGEEEG